MQQPLQEQHTLIISALAQGLLPQTGSIPGAHQLPVTQMIADVVVQWDSGQREIFEQSLLYVDGLALDLLGARLVDLSDDQAVHFVSLIAQSEELSDFWEPMRKLLVLNYYALPPVYSELGFPGPSIDNGGLSAFA
ncbi:gluconate 2-dehydrogenase subunit 3 family protein [Agaribacterium haliotis]|uniref:gluconate 2-dehydrogenase subunit 3 family protein n=1 Tax=Agaribacterium haliotis TaxID=2013869 RepID=UPI000BB588E9|nr:gluconate 2-dehydrogenase subunit 3 family protein [Agaribacterium haliotis]